MPSGRASLFRASPTGPGPLLAAAGAMRPPRFRTKDFSTRMGSPTAQGPSHTRHSSHQMMLPSPQRQKDQHLGNASFAAQYPAHGLPCERFTSALASCRASLGAGGLARPCPVEDFHLLSFASLSWRSPFLAMNRSSDYLRATSAYHPASDIRWRCPLFTRLRLLHPQQPTFWTRLGMSQFDPTRKSSNLVAKASASR